eukprot:Rhum_TRINITY_DN8807_c0_g2::Rhum_TRINITY_DN8807_c0_g2_i1::g.29988::m.29988
MSSATLGVPLLFLSLYSASSSLVFSLSSSLRPFPPPPLSQSRRRRNPPRCRHPRRHLREDVRQLIGLRLSSKRHRLRVRRPPALDPPLLAQLQQVQHHVRLRRLVQVLRHVLVQARRDLRRRELRAGARSLEASDDLHVALLAVRDVLLDLRLPRPVLPAQHRPVRRAHRNTAARPRLLEQPAQRRHVLRQLREVRGPGAQHDVAAEQRVLFLQQEAHAVLRVPRRVQRAQRRVRDADAVAVGDVADGGGCAGAQAGEHARVVARLRHLVDSRVVAAVLRLQHVGEATHVVSVPVRQHDRRNACPLFLQHAAEGGHVVRAVPLAGIDEDAAGPAADKVRVGALQGEGAGVEAHNAGDQGCDALDAQQARHLLLEVGVHFFSLSLFSFFVWVCGCRAAAFAAVLFFLLLLFSSAPSTNEVQIL